MHCAFVYGQFKKAPLQLISAPGIVPGALYLCPIDNGDDYILRLHDPLAFTEGFSELLHDLATSNNMFQAYNENENGQFVLTTPSSRNGFIFHLVSNQVVRVLCVLELDELREEVTAFFQPQFNNWDSMQFTVKEKHFEEFIRSIQLKEKINFWLAADQFANDFHEENGNIVNSSLFRTEDEGLPHFLKVVMLLVGKERIWAIKEEEREREKNITIRTLHKVEWQKLL
ncbi:hypothetical protein LC048_00305 [Mesobacillus subterraneus]|uniref:hypothetical protein n=1 Tax=Mesobacillus subterraneus TaxID=285983 RepID=UPI001CFDF970|nr:hypothetical protein [Mesobacillus subterraneus]WLR55505.1 hypothetical protein LC048_00305 [Mesobacillus subterraneus]